MSLLQVSLSRMKLRYETPIALVPLIASMPPSSVHPTTEYPSKTATSMTVELQELLSWAIPDTSDPVPDHTAPRRLQSVTLGSHLLTEEEGFHQSESMDSTTPSPAVTLMPSDDPCASTIILELPVSLHPKQYRQ